MGIKREQLVHLMEFGLPSYCVQSFFTLDWVFFAPVNCYLNNRAFRSILLELGLLPLTALLITLSARGCASLSSLTLRFERFEPSRR